MKKKKILHVTESFGSGVFSFLVDLINNTDEEYDVTVAYGKRVETLENFKEYFSNRVKFVEVKNFTRSINPTKDIKAFFEVKKIIKDENPDVIHLHSSKAGFIGRFAGNGKKVIMLYNPHGFSFLMKDSSKVKRLIYWLLEKIGAMRKCTVVGCSQGEYEEALKLTTNSICINNGINIKQLDFITRNFEKKNINFDNLSFCTSGRIGYQKNPQMFNEIAKSFPNNKFTWIGDGEFKNELTSSNIEITGWKERDEVLELVNKHDVFLLTSLWEGLPISLLEAMYLGKICIVSNCIGNKDVINNKNGFISNDKENFERIISEIINNSNIKEIETIKDNIKNDLENEFNIELMIKKYKKIYENHDEKKINDKPVVVHIVNSNIYSGLEKVAINIIEQLKDSYDFYYACKDGSIEEVLKKKNIKRIKIEELSKKEILRIEKEYKPEIIHAHDYRATLVSGLFLKNTKIISHLHNNSPWLKKCFHPYNYMFLIALLNKNIKKILTVSKSIENEYVFSKLIKDKIYLIGNPININSIVSNINFDIQKEYDVCFSGRLTEQKDPLKFIRVISKLQKKYPKIKALMLGDGELKEECIKVINEKKLQNNIELKGFVQEPFKEMIKSKVFCLTSKWEGFGLVAVEAQVLGIPCVVSNVGGLKDVIMPNAGALVEKEEEFVNKIDEYLQNNKCQYDSDKVKEMIDKKYNIVKYVENVKNEYSKL